MRIHTATAFRAGRFGFGGGEASLKGIDGKDNLFHVGEGIIRVNLKYGYKITQLFYWDKIMMDNEQIYFLILESDLGDSGNCLKTLLFVNEFLFLKDDCNITSELAHYLRSISALFLSNQRSI